MLMHVPAATCAHSVDAVRSILSMTLARTELQLTPVSPPVVVAMPKSLAAALVDMCGCGI
jgi:hypothetical protein